MSELIRLENWCVTSRTIDPYKAPEQGAKCLGGNAYGHPRFEDGHPVTTSPIIKVDPDTRQVTTKSGSVYVLGSIDPRYLEEYPDAENRFFAESNISKLNEAYKEVPKNIHVDDFIDRMRAPPEKGDGVSYAQFVLLHLRLPAWQKMAFDPFMKNHILYADYKGKRVRINVASRLGDLGITNDLSRTTGYEERVFVNELTNFGPNP